MEILQQVPESWDTEADSASISMKVRNNNTVPEEFTLSIVCVAVPGS
jgi:hypothetical protein